MASSRDTIFLASVAVLYGLQTGVSFAGVPIPSICAGDDTACQIYTGGTGRRQVSLIVVAVACLLLTGVAALGAWAWPRMTANLSELARRWGPLGLGVVLVVLASASLGLTVELSDDCGAKKDRVQGTVVAASTSFVLAVLTTAAWAALIVRGTR